MNEIDLRTPSKTRAEDAQPFVPSHLAEPMLRDRDNQSTQLEYVARGLGEIRVRADILADPYGGASMLDRDMATQIGEEATRLQRLLRSILKGGVAGVVALALVTVALVAGPASGRAQAAEVPTPDPTGSVATAPVYRVVLDRLVKAVPVPVVSHTPSSAGYCVSVVRLGQPLGRSCSSVPWFTVTAWVDARVTPLGRVVAYVADDATGASVPIVLDVRRPSRFGTGTFIDMGRGDLYVYAPLTAYTATKGAWTPQQYSPVQVQVAGRHGFRTVATLTTTRYGVASGIVHLGGGVRVFRVARPAGATVWSTVGTAHRMNLLTEPVDVV